MKFCWWKEECRSSLEKDVKYLERNFFVSNFQIGVAWTYFLAKGKKRYFENMGIVRLRKKT